MTIASQRGAYWTNRPSAASAGRALEPVGVVDDEQGAARRPRFERRGGVLDASPSCPARRGARTGRPPRGGGPSTPRRRPRTRPGTTRPGRRTARRSRREASSCRSRPGPRRRRGGDPRSCPAADCSRSRGNAAAGGTRTLAATTGAPVPASRAVAPDDRLASFPSGNTDPTWRRRTGQPSRPPMVPPRQCGRVQRFRWRFVNVVFASVSRLSPSAQGICQAGNAAAGVVLRTAFRPPRGSRPRRSRSRSGRRRGRTR